MPVMNFDLEDGLPPVSFDLKPADAERFAAFMAECDKAIKNQQWTDSDLPLPEDQAILDAHPLNTKDFQTYAEAQRLVSAKRSKFALVDLVNWLLSRVPR